MEFGTNCDDNLKEVSPSMNCAAQDLLLFKELPLSMVVTAEMENENMEELFTESNLEKSHCKFLIVMMTINQLQWQTNMMKTKGMVY